MNRILCTTLAPLTSTATLAQSTAKLPATGVPATPKRPVTDVYFGKPVVDNYRWLEDMSSPETQAWFKAQGDYTNAVLAQIPGRDKLIQTFTDYENLVSEHYREIKRRGNTYFYRKTLANENVGSLYMREVENGSATPGPEKLLFDPTTFKKGKTYSVSAFTPSPDGKMLVIGLQEGGAELSILRIMDLATNTAPADRFLPESITAVFGGQVGWLPDNSGFLYTPDNSMDTKDPKRSLDTKARLHKLGSDPAQDPELFSRAKNPDMGFRPDHLPTLSFSNDNTQLYGYLTSDDSRVDAFMADPADLSKPTITWKRLVSPTDSVTSLVKFGNKMFLKSIKNSPNDQILVMDANRPNLASATVLLPESKLNITRMVATKDFLFVTLSDGINEKIRQYDSRNGQWADVPIPATGTVIIDPYDASHSNGISAYITSWNIPGTLYDYDPETRQIAVSPFNVQPNYPGVADLVVKELEIPGHDERSGQSAGAVPVMVPLSLVYKKGLKRDGSAVSLMTGYGAYGNSGTPYFIQPLLALLNQDVVLAVTHVRGGSEKGQNWYKAGFQTTKPNTWKDFISCGEYLIKNGYASPQYLIGMGFSAGSILIGRAITERPDLFAAAISSAGLSNPLRAEETPNGPINVPEFGTVKDSVQYMALYEMDAFQHVKDGTKYPAVICVGGMNDPRVIAWQPGKFAAARQNATTSGKPVLMQVNYDNGHFTEDKAVAFRNFANMWAFALWQAGHPDFQRSVAPPAKATARKK